MIQTIENSILNALKKQFVDYEVDSFPLKFEDYQITSPKGAILVRFEDGNFQNAAIYANNSDEKVNFTVFCAQRYLFKHNDAYPLLEEIKDVLNGLNILNKRLYLSKRQFEDVINGDVWHSFSVNISLPNTDKYPDLSEANISATALCEQSEGIGVQRANGKALSLADSPKTVPDLSEANLGVIERI